MLEIFNQMNIYIFAKDTQGKYIFCNDMFSKLFGIANGIELIGKSDQELICKHHTQFLNEQDAEIIAGKEYINIYKSVAISGRSWDVLISKYRLLNKSADCIGIIGHFIDVTGYDLYPKKGYYDETNKRFVLDKNQPQKYLTEKEYIIFKKILMGNTAPEIAKQLSLSSRTVEDYIKNIRIKLKCSTKGQIVEYAMKNGMAHILK